MKSTDAVYAEKIAEQYAKKSTPKVVALKKLDRKARKPAELFAYTFGIVGALVLGVGMCLAMGVIGSGSAAFVGGIVIGVLGIAMVSVNYPIYNRLLAKGKEKYASDIMRLAKEISESAE